MEHLNSVPVPGVPGSMPGSIEGGNLSPAMRHLDGMYTQGFNRRSGVKEIQACIEKCCEEPGARKRLLVWALKRHTPLRLREIAEKIDCAISDSAVSQICRRVEKECAKNKGLQGMAKRIELEMSKVKT